MSPVMTLRNHLWRYVECGFFFNFLFIFLFFYLFVLFVGQKPSNASHMSKFSKIHLRIWDVQVTNCEVGEVKMWKKCIKSSVRLVRAI